MFERFFPDAYMDSTYVIDFEKLYKEGIRGVIFDIDNTLVPHGAPADERAIRLFARLRSIGLDYCLISNNQLKAMKLMHVDLDSCIFVGDQIFTDVYGAKRCGMRTILVKPLHPKEEIQIVLKRYLEKIVLYFYQKEKR